MVRPRLYMCILVVNRNSHYHLSATRQANKAVTKYRRGRILWWAENKPAIEGERERERLCWSHQNGNGHSSLMGHLLLVDWTPPMDWFINSVTFYCPGGRSKSTRPSIEQCHRQHLFTPPIWHCPTTNNSIHSDWLIAWKSFRQRGHLTLLSEYLGRDSRYGWTNDRVVSSC